jgi:hypothetical protein
VAVRGGGAKAVCWICVAAGLGHGVCVVLGWGLRVCVACRCCEFVTSGPVFGFVEGVWGMDGLG